MKQVWIILMLSLSFVGCSSNSKSNYIKSSQASIDIAKNVKMDKRHISYLQGVAKYKKGDYVEAVKYFKVAAEQNHIVAINDLGSMYYSGKGVPQDYKKALSYFEQVTARTPDDNANYNIGQIYFQGLGVQKDYNKAITNFRIASKMGNSSATNVVGYMHEKGLGVKANNQTARDYYIKAAIDGDSFAINNLGTLSESSGDLKEARQWYEKSAAKGNKLAIKNIAKLDAKGL